VTDDFVDRNVTAQEEQPTSMLNVYRALTALRCSEPALSVGRYIRVDNADHSDLYVFKRAFNGADDFLVVLNLGDQDHNLDLSAVASDGTIEISTNMQRSGDINLASIDLGPDEGLVIRL
jgi:glycosidase